MKKTFILLLGASLMLASCGMIAQTSSSDDGQRFQDGIYASSPSFRTKAERTASKSETESLIEKTKASQIYLFGEKKDTIMIPENMYARIQFDQKVGGTVVTVGENPYDWRWDLENNYGYYYGPYSLGASWYWSRHYSPYWSSWGYYSPWRHRGWYDPWYYGSMWADPWYYGSWYNNWCYTGWYDPWYYGGYWGWNDPWYHYHHHGWYNPHHHPGHIHHGNIAITPGHETNRWHGLRTSTINPGNRRTSIASSSTSDTDKTTIRRGIGSSSKVGRTASISRGTTSGSRSSSTTRTSSAPTYRRPAGTTASANEGSSNSYSRNSSYSNSSSSRNTSSDYNRSSSSVNSGYTRSSSTGGGYSRGGYSGGGGGGSYSRGSSGSYRR